MSAVKSKFDSFDHIKNIQFTNFKMVVTPTFYKVLVDRYGKKWAEKHAIVNQLVPPMHVDNNTR